MISIKGPSDKACFICGKTEGTVECSFDDKTFKGVLCMGHIHAKVKGAGKEVKDAPTVRSGAA